MGEAKRGKLIGTYPPQDQPLSRSEAIAFAMGILAAAGDEEVAGVTLIPADGSEPLYLAAETARRPPGRRH